MQNSIFTIQQNKDRLNQVSARENRNSTGKANEFYIGKIKTSHANGTYEIELLGDDGTTVIRTYDGVFNIGSSATYSVGETVHLKFANQDQPEIFAAGGSGATSCAIGLYTFGVKYGR